MQPITSVSALPLRQPEGFTTAHHNGSGFKNPWPSYQGSTVPTLLKARWSIPKNFVPVPADRLGLVAVRKPDFAAQQDGLKATWIGHASFMIETSMQKGSDRGVRILLDPVWSERVGPYGMVGPVRFTPAPCTIDELPEIDAVCISHDHYDHLDSDTLKKLNAKHDGDLRYFCALGVKSVLTGLGVGIKAEQVTEMDWWDGMTLERDGVGSVELICTPAQHRSGRAPWNFDGTLWCSWAVKEPGAGGKRLFFAGDTGYCHVTSDTEYSHHNAPHPPCPAFKDIGNIYGPFDLALVPAGCFKPRSILSGQHSSPEDSLAIHRDVRSKKSIAMHYGTFRGAFSAQYEPVTEPVERWKKGAEAEGLEWDVECHQNHYRVYIAASFDRSDAEHITSHLHRYGVVLASHSLPDLLDIYTRNGVLMAPGFQPAVGTDALKSSYERIFSTIKLEIKFNIDEIVVASDEWAFARTTAEGTKHWLQKGTQERHWNQELFVLQKVSGDWKVARYCFSSMKPAV